MTRKIYIPVDISMKPFKPLREEDSKFRNPKLKSYRAETNVFPHDSMRKKKTSATSLTCSSKEGEKKISVAGAVYGRRGRRNYQQQNTDKISPLPPLVAGEAI